VRALVPLPILPLAALLAGPLLAQLTPQQKQANLDSFDVVWKTVRDRHPDPTLNGLNWTAVRAEVRPRIESATSMDQVRDTLRAMLARLAASHYSIIPAELYHDATASLPGAPDTTALPRTERGGENAGDGIAPVIVGSKTAVANVEPAASSANTPVPEGTLVRFGNLPETRVFFETRKLPGGAGYIRFNEFLDPAGIMPKFESAMRDYRGAPGIVLDLRGNPGGIGIMAMGIAGFFVDKPGQKLGDMKMRDTTLKFVIFPRPETYNGPLAILVDAGSASTTEILAGGLQDLGRARIFGERSAGAALPSDIIRLPNGDGFQYAQASFTSVGGKVLEGAGVTPDTVVHDGVIEAAEQWIASRP
jgi:carboxyl-terminal processing protease